MANINTLMIYLATLGENPGLEPGGQVSNTNEHNLPGIYLIHKLQNYNRKSKLGKMGL